MNIKARHLEINQLAQTRDWSGLFSSTILFALMLISVNVGFAQQRKRQANPAVVLTSSRDRLYRTFLREAARRPANFAGHYVLGGPGCGMECEMYAAIDKMTGRVIWLPFVITDWTKMAEASNETRPIRFSLDSNRIVVLGHLEFEDKHTESGWQTWRLAGTRFVRVRR